MPPFEPIGAEWVSAVAAVAGVLLAGGAAWIALSQLQVTARQVREAAEQAAADSEERTRPYLGLNMEPGLWGAGSADLVVVNFGQTTARNIHLELASGPLGTGPLLEGDKLVPALERELGKPFDLAPGMRRRIVWRVNAPFGLTGRHGAPNSGELIATYEWHPGQGRDSKRYEERYSFDLDSLMALSPDPTTGPNRKGVVEVLKAMTGHIGQLRR